MQSEVPSPREARNVGKCQLRVGEREDSLVMQRRPPDIYF